MNRGKEIHELLSLEMAELTERAKEHLVVLENLDELHQHFARSLADEIKQNNQQNKPTVLILPFGPVAQYPIFIEIIHKERISLENCIFFFMDEYTDINGIEVSEDHPESFRAGFKRLFADVDSSLMIPDDQLIFPTSKNIYHLKSMIDQAGGIQTCYGGIGIHGHLAFNEPEDGVRWTDPRLVYLNDFTVTMNAIRGNVGGDVINFPQKALTLGIKQIMNADKIRLYCRNDVEEIDWANTVLRLAVLGTPGDDYPVTYIRDHIDYQVITDKNTAAKPKHVLDVPENPD